MDFQTPEEYLKWQYSKRNNRVDVSNIDLDIYFQAVKNIYGDEQIELYEHDKVLFKKLRKMSFDLNLPIKEQERSTYWLLNRHSQNIIKIARENKIFIPDDIVLGTIPMDDSDAYLKVFPNKQILLAVNQWLFDFLYLMGRIVSSFIPKKNNNSKNREQIFSFDKNAIYENIQNNKKEHGNFVKTLFLYFTCSDFKATNLFFKKDNSINLSAILWDTAELFIVAHEYAHIILKHIDVNHNTVNSDKNLNEDINANFIKEFTADNLAIQFVLAHNNNNKEGFGIMCFLGIEFLFACFNIIDKISSKDVNKTHPSPELRIMNIKNYLSNILPQEVQSVFQASEVIKYIIYELWNKNEKIIYDIYNNKLCM